MLVVPTDGTGLPLTKAATSVRRRYAGRAQAGETPDLAKRYIFPGPPSSNENGIALAKAADRAYACWLPPFVIAGRDPAIDTATRLGELTVRFALTPLDMDHGVIGKAKRRRSSNGYARW